MLAVAEIEIVPVMLPCEAEITDCPTPGADANPVALRLTAAELEELQVAELVRFCVLPSLKLPLAVSCSLIPVGSNALGALRLIDWSVGPVTISTVAFDVIPF